MSKNKEPFINTLIDLDHFDLSSLKTMTDKELTILAQAIRLKIMKTVSQNGGHLASNLGVVELTIALHQVFDSPFDKIIFDVSHQVYPHKILTGRAKDFDKLRTFQGLSGFAKRSESIHDAFDAGHSSTALSAGLGMSFARSEFPDQIGEIITIVGDASLPNGLSFEALNYLGANKNHKVIIIINDNEMSISKNVGALAKAFNRIRVKRPYAFINYLTPRFMKRFYRRIKSSIKTYVYNNQFFNALGFKYFEGIDGHDFEQLRRYLTFAKKSKESVVLHVKTTKGRGYRYAEEDNTGIWHGVGPFEIDSGTIKNFDINKQTFGEIIANHILKITDNNSLIRVITPAMALGSGLQLFKWERPNQFIDVGIAEESAVVMAASMCQEGLKPIVFIYSTFLQRSYDQIIHDVARNRLPVIFCVDRSGIVDDDGDTHQGIFDIAFLRSIPYLTLTMPKDASEAKGLIDLAINHQDGPFVIRYPKYSLLTDASIPSKAITYGTWEIILPLKKRTIISYGPDVSEILLKLETEALDESFGLINARFIKPLDHECMKKLINNQIEVIVYEQVIKTSSLSSAILENYSQIKLISVSLPETFLETGKVQQLKQAYHISIDELINILKEE